VTDRFLGYGDNGGMPIEKAVSRKPKKPKSRSADYEGVDEEGFIPNLKGMTMTDDINRGPFHAIIEKQARARQAVTGESFAKAFTECYTDPANAQIRDLAKFEHLAQGEDAICGTRLSMIPAQKAAPADALQDDVDPVSAEYELHSRTITRMKNSPGMSYQRAFTHEYLAPENRSLKNRVTSEGILRMQAMAPAKPFPAYTAPGHAGEASNVGRSGAKPRGYAGG
jgi:hypothetical protein